MVTKIGITAGSILEFLDKSEEAQLSDLISCLEFSPELILMSIGWMVRKGYISLEKESQGYKIHLRQRLNTCP